MRHIPGKYNSHFMSTSELISPVSSSKTLLAISLPTTTKSECQQDALNHNLFTNSACRSYLRTAHPLNGFQVPCVIQKVSLVVSDEARPLLAVLIDSLWARARGTSRSNWVSPRGSWFWSTVVAVFISIVVQGMGFPPHHLSPPLVRLQFSLDDCDEFVVGDHLPGSASVCGEGKVAEGRGHYSWREQSLDVGFPLTREIIAMH